MGINTKHQSKIKSLLKLLQSTNDDFTKVNLLNELGWEFVLEAQFLESKVYFKKSEQLAQKLGYKSGLAESYCFLGRGYEFEGNYAQSLESQFKALAIREDIEDQKGISYSLHYLGDIFLSQANLTDADTVFQDCNKKALDYFFKSLSVAQQIDDKQSIANSYNCIGNTYRQLNNSTKATVYYSKAMKLREKIGDKRGFIVTYNNMGKLQIQIGNYSQALEYLFKSLNLSEEIGDKRAIVKALNSVGNCYLMQKNYSKAKEYFIQSLNLSNEINFLEFIVSAHHALSEIFETKDYEEYNIDLALFYFKEYIKGRDRINSKKLAQVEMNFEFQKKEAALKSEQDKKNAVAAAIEKKNIEIIDSINYALRIQKAILPIKDEIYNVLPNTFILNKPKDIVSGDFYFFYQTKQIVFIAAADCTGHGVPGALMSMIGSEKLKESVQQTKLVGDALSKLNNGIKTALKQSENEDSTHDGMDIALCSIDVSNKILKYAGANRPIWIIRNGHQEITEIKATKKAIGGFTESTQHFETHEIKLQLGDTFYLFTDGYADTFSKHDKKLTSKRFKDVLINIQEKNMQEQEQYLNDFIENWRDDAEPIDDILVIGIRI